MLILSSDLLCQFAEIKIFMSTKMGGVSPLPYCLNFSGSVGDKPENVKQNRSLFFNTIGITESNIAIPKQIHSDFISIVTNAGIYPDCDALITNLKDLYLTILIADCVPIFLYDPKENIIGLIHSGWKGTAKEILSKTLRLMINNLNSKAENIYAFIGPSASKCCYEVDRETAKHFKPDLLIEKNEKKFFLDLKAANYKQIKNHNIPDKNIEISDHCTICNPELFHSYRRDGKESGRMMAVIGIQN
jgi:polyphenol oxidase